MCNICIEGHLFVVSVTSQRAQLLLLSTFIFAFAGYPYVLLVGEARGFDCALAVAIFLFFFFLLFAKLLSPPNNTDELLMQHRQLLLLPLFGR